MTNPLSKYSPEFLNSTFDDAAKFLRPSGAGWWLEDGNRDAVILAYLRRVESDYYRAIWRCLQHFGELPDRAVEVLKNPNPKRGLPPVPKGFLNGGRYAIPASLKSSPVRPAAPATVATPPPPATPEPLPEPTSAPEPEPAAPEAPPVVVGGDTDSAEDLARFRQDLDSSLGNDPLSKLRKSLLVGRFGLSTHS